MSYTVIGIRPHGFHHARPSAVRKVAAPDSRNRPLDVFCALASPIVWLATLGIPRQGQHRRHAA